ncbi:hypothetical protein MNBD_NITROSPIRAE01-881 [hydrothermal vent metagenome]|uniref:Uncharacterized protein n=1 Tax=hydrothermal vent metagenome TaxID=652676 RepID=A0A3B1D4R4_9ZZZZ
MSQGSHPIFCQAFLKLREKLRTPCLLLMKFKSLSHSFLFVSISIFSVFSFVVPVGAQVFDDEPEQSLRRHWSVVLETSLIFDDNVFLEKATKQSDQVVQSGLVLGYERGDIFFSALAVIDRYRENKILDYSYYEIGMETPLDSDRTTGSIFLNFSPTAPLDTAEAGETFELSSRGLNVFLDHEMSWGSLGFSFAFSQLDYSRIFDAKDSKITALGPTFFYLLNEIWTLSGDATFERSRAVGGLIGRRPDDISYRATNLSLQTRYYFSQVLNFRFRYYLRNKNFTTEVDDIHAGRRDITQIIGLYSEIRPSSDFIFRVGFEETWLISENNPAVEFKARRWLFSAAYSF